MTTYFTTRTGGLAGRGIRVFLSLTSGKRVTVNHAGILLSDGVTTVEAKPHGVAYGKITDYAAPHVAHKPALTSEQSQRLDDVAKALIGRRYNWLDIVAIGLLRVPHLPRIPWLRDRVARTDRLICSQAVDLAYFLIGVHLFDDGRLSQDVTPSDLDELIHGVDRGVWYNRAGVSHK